MGQIAEGWLVKVCVQHLGVVVVMNQLRSLHYIFSMQDVRVFNLTRQHSLIAIKKKNIPLSNGWTVVKEKL